MKTVIKYSDGIAMGSENISPEMKEVFDSATCLKQDYIAEEYQTKVMSDFFDKVIEEEVLA